MRTLLICFILIQFLVGAAKAKSSIPDDVYFGPEWTFTLWRSGVVDSEFDREDFNEKKKAIWNQFKNLCAKSKKCSVGDQALLGGFNVFFKNGLIIAVTHDPGVIEVKSNVHTLIEFQNMREFVQENVFNQFKNIGMVPHEREGAGHANIDLNYFKNKPLLLFNFLVDFYNHPGLGVVLNSITANMVFAKYLDQMSEISWDGHDIFKKSMSALPVQIEKLRIKLSKKNNLTSEDILMTFLPVLKEKNVALGIRSVIKKLSPGVQQTIEFSPSSRLEVRTLRPQETAFDYQLVLEIFRARIDYLKTIKEPIALKAITPVEDGWVALGQYADYLEKAGLELERYKPLMPEMWRDLDEKNYIRDARVKSKLGVKVTCEGLFGK